MFDAYDDIINDDFELNPIRFFKHGLDSHHEFKYNLKGIPMLE